MRSIEWESESLANHSSRFPSPPNLPCFITLTSHNCNILEFRSMASDADAKYELITRRLQEVLGADSIKAILAEGKAPKCYWGR